MVICSRSVLLPCCAHLWAPCRPRLSPLNVYKYCHDIVWDADCILDITSLPIGFLNPVLHKKLFPRKLFCTVCRAVLGFIHIKEFIPSPFQAVISNTILKNVTVMCLKTSYKWWCGHSSQPSEMTPEHPENCQAAVRANRRHAGTGELLYCKNPETTKVKQLGHCHDPACKVKYAVAFGANCCECGNLTTAKEKKCACRHRICEDCEPQY